MEAETKMHYRAHMQVTQGNRLLSDFMANAGLGLAGAGYVEVFVINYKLGEKVDVARVSRAMYAMIAESERLQTEFKIIGYKVLRLELVLQNKTHED